MTKEYYRPKEVEEVFGIPRKTVTYLFNKGVLKGCKIGKMIFINAVELRNRMLRVESGEPSEIVFYCNK